MKCSGKYEFNKFGRFPKRKIITECPKKWSCKNYDFRAKKKREDSTKYDDCYVETFRGRS